MDDDDAVPKAHIPNGDIVEMCKKLEQVCLSNTEVTVNPLFLQDLYMMSVCSCIL
jgi:hypothetical protein